MDNHQHFIEKCSCGKTISQCRCMGQKTLVINAHACEECKEKKTKPVLDIKDVKRS